LDRQEKATEGGQDVPYSDVQDVRRQLGLQVCAIAKLGDLMHYLKQGGGGATPEDRQRVFAYRERYGVDEG
jgi:orotate phosphoribosyltransferase